MAISFVGSASLATRNLNGSFTLSKPSGVTAGDFLIGMVAHWPGSDEGDLTITPPAGWTISNGGYQYASGGSTRMVVMVRTAQAGDPSSWNGTYNGTEDVEVTIVAAYRGATGIVASEVDVRGSATSYTVGSVSNSAATSWRVTIGSYVSSTKNYAIQSNESSLRKRDGYASGSKAVEAGIWDSNGTVSTGSHSRTISRSAVWTSSVAWIGILEANTTTLTATFEASMPLPVVAASGSLGYAGTLGVSTPIPTMTASGIASPPEGTLAALVAPTMSVTGVHEASGTLDVVAAPIVDVVGETRRFGIRVVTPEAESRLTTPRLGASD